jgi:hypothetical protein
MKSVTTEYIEKRFGNLVFDLQKTIMLTFYNQASGKDESISCNAYICNISNVKPTVGLLLVSTNYKPVPSGTLYNLPWFQFQIRTYDNFEQVKRAIGALLKQMPYPQNLISNNFEEPPIEIKQVKHDEDRIKYLVEEQEVNNPNFEVVLFSETSQDIDGVNLEPVMNLCDALEDLNFCVHRSNLS